VKLAGSELKKFAQLSHINHEKFWWKKFRTNFSTFRSYISDKI